MATIRADIYNALLDGRKPSRDLDQLIKALEGVDARGLKHLHPSDTSNYLTNKQYDVFRKAYYIVTVQRYALPESKEIILAAAGLLEGYDKILPDNSSDIIQARLRCYIQHSGINKTLGTLSKYERNKLKALADALFDLYQENKLSLCDDVFRYFGVQSPEEVPEMIILPSPSYMKDTSSVVRNVVLDVAEQTIECNLIQDHNFMMIREAGTGEPYQYSLVLEPRKRYEVFVDFDCLNATFAAGDKQPAETIELTFPGKLPAKQQKPITGILHHSNRHAAVEFKPASIISQHNLYVYLNECPDGIVVDANQEAADQGKKMRLRIIFGYNDSCVTGLDRFANPLQRLLYKAEDKAADYAEEYGDADYWTAVQRKRRGQFSFCGTPDSVDTKLPSSFFDGMEILLDGATGCFTFEIATCSRWNLITRIRHRIL